MSLQHEEEKTVIRMLVEYIDCLIGMGQGNI